MLGEARVSGDACQTGGGGAQICPTGSTYDVANNVCIIREPGAPGGVIVVGATFQGPSGGTVISLIEARRLASEGTLPNSQCLRGSGPQFVVLGTNRADRITGTNRRDRILGLGGNDQIDGGRKDDCLDGNRGRDRVAGGLANDRLYGNGGRDKLTGGLGNDRLYGGAARRLAQHRLRPRLRERRRGQRPGQRRLRGPAGEAAGRRQGPRPRVVQPQRGPAPQRLRDHPQVPLVPPHGAGRGLLPPGA